MARAAEAESESQHAVLVGQVEALTTELEQAVQSLEQVQRDLAASADRRALPWLLSWSKPGRTCKMQPTQRANASRGLRN